MTLAVGAGLYEELLFRLVLIAGLHLLLVDVARMKNVPGSMVAAAMSAGAFAWYHDVPGLPMGLPLATFYVLSGLYFAGLFIVRGFGIVRPGIALDAKQKVRRNQHRLQRGLHALLERLTRRDALGG